MGTEIIVYTKRIFPPEIIRHIIVRVQQGITSGDFQFFRYHEIAGLAEETIGVHSIAVRFRIFCHYKILIMPREAPVFHTQFSNTNYGISILRFLIFPLNATEAPIVALNFSVFFISVSSTVSYLPKGLYLRLSTYMSSLSLLSSLFTLFAGFSPSPLKTAAWYSR